MTDSSHDLPALGGTRPVGQRWDRIDFVATTGSTNADLAVEARAGAAPGRVLVAAEQTAGRGRLTRRWESPAGSCVAMSVLLAPSQPAKRWGWLSLLAGLAVADALAELVPEGVDVGVKWPNDVLLDGRKVCGILSERIEHPDGARAVIGIGINLTLTKEQLPVPGATSLLLVGAQPSREAVVAGVLTQLDERLAQWERDGTVRDDYRARCCSLGAELTITPTGRSPIPGVGHDVDPDGCLQVRTANGVATYAVGDVVHARLA